MVSQFLFLLVPALLLIKLQHGSLRAAIPLRMPKPVETILVILCVISMQQVLEGYLFFQDQLPLPGAVREFVETMKRMIEEAVKLLGEAQSVPELVYVVLVVAVTPAICEEIFFRGLVQENVSLASNPRMGFALTGIIFAMYHLNPFLLIPLTVLGIFFSYVRYRSQTIIIPIVAHFVNNGISAVGFFWQQRHANGAFMLEGGEADVASGYVLGVMAVAAVICALSFAAYQTVTTGIDTQQTEGTV
jgi:membrane protease YdiL (CAAX protease family)